MGKACFANYSIFCFIAVAIFAVFASDAFHLPALCLEVVDLGFLEID